MQTSQIVVDSCLRYLYYSHQSLRSAKRARLACDNDVGRAPLGVDEQDASNGRRPARAALLRSQATTRIDPRVGARPQSYRYLTLRSDLSVVFR